MEIKTIIIIIFLILVIIAGIWLVRTKREFIDVFENFRRK